MTMTRRLMLAASAAGLGTADLSAAAEESAVPMLTALSEQSNAALMRGDIEAYLSMIRLPDEFVLMSPFGGKPSRGSEYDRARLDAMGRFFRNGRFRQEIVASYETQRMVVLVLNEYAQVEVGGLPAQECALRVTLVYRRDAQVWSLVHRHADPLVRGISLELAAQLALPDHQPKT